MLSSVAVPDPLDEGVTVRESVASAAAGENGTLFGRYRTLRELGRGGMGLVVLAHDTLLDVPVALKLVPEIVLRDSEGMGDLKKEVLRGMELTHPNIVRVFSFEQDAKVAVIVMEHVQGETLAQKKAQRPSHCFDCNDILPWVEQLCAALDYAHREARIAHRDLKPSNLLVTQIGRLKIADFGIASSLSDTMSRVSVRVDSAGTPPYMSPQQAMGERPTHLDDIYSLGATIYELLTGKPPFFRGNILAQVMSEEPVPMNQRRAELEVKGAAPIPEAWEKMVAACLSKHPAARPSSGAAVLAMITNSGGALALSALAPAAGWKLDMVPGAKSHFPPPPADQGLVRREPKPAKIVVRREFNLQPIVDAVGALVRGTVELIGAALRPIFILALILAAIWGGLVLKQKWEAGQAERDEAAAKQAAAANLAQAAAAPAATAPQVIYLPPPRPNPLERGPIPDPGGRGPHPRPPRR